MAKKAETEQPVVSETEALLAKIAELEAQLKAQNEPAPAPEPKEEKKVLIRIPRTSKDQPDVYVSVNERSWLIQPGKEVEVPECVAEVLRHKEEALERAYEYESSVMSD